MTTTTEIIGKLIAAQTLIDEARIALEAATTPPAPPPAPVDRWRDWIKAVVQSDLVPNEIKPAVIAQSIVETGRGKSELFVAHKNPLGMKWRIEMKGWAIPVNVAVTSEPSGFGTFCKFSTERAMVEGWAKWMERSPYDGWRQHADSSGEFLRFVCPIWAADAEYLAKCLSVLAEAVQLASSAGWSSSSPTPTQRLRGRKILVDPGHSKSATGAHGRGNVGLTEYAMNTLQAKVVSEMLRAEGAEVEVFDPNPDSLTAVGRRAVGKDLFLSLHHNAANADGVDEGTETYVPRAAGSKCRALARAVNTAVVRRISSRDRGVKERDFTVIATALAVGCPLCLLVESYFLDDYASLDVTSHRSKEAAKAIAQAVIEWDEWG